MAKKRTSGDSTKPKHLANGGELKMELTPDREKRIAVAQDSFQRQSRVLATMQFKPLDWVTTKKNE